MPINEDPKNNGQQEPLIHRPPNVKTSTSHHNGNQWMVYLCTFVAVCGSYEFGTVVGYSSPVQSALMKDLSLTTAEYAMFGSIVTFGAMIGAVTSGPIADIVGRKWAMRISGAFCTAGWLAIFFAKGPVPLDIGRLAAGYGIGVFSYVVPVFVAEIAPKELRGALTAVNQLMIVTGVSVSFIIGTVLPWRTLALTGIIPCAIQIFGLFFIPESPRWLAKTGRDEEFEVALQKLRGKDANISTEAEEIQDYIETLKRLPKAKVLDLFQSRYLRPVIIGVGLMIFQQFGGINGVCFYVSNTFESAGVSASFGTTIYAILQVVITGLNTLVIDRAGRKPLLLVAATGLIIGCLLTGTSFYLKNHRVALNLVPGFAIAGILVYISAFSAGMGAVPWVIMSEIFPINIKGVGGSLVTLVNWIGAWAVSYTFNFLTNWSSYGTFILYAAVNALAIIFVIMVVPETKGRTLEQIQAVMSTRRNNRT